MNIHILLDKKELFTYIIYIYLILYNSITFKKLTFKLLSIILLIIYFGSLSMFPIWKCKKSIFYNYGYIVVFFYSILCVALLYFINTFHNILTYNPLYISFLLSIPIFYYCMIKMLQYFYNCNTSFLKTDTASFYLLIIFIMLMPIIHKYLIY